MLIRAFSTSTQIYVSMSSQRVPCDSFARKGYPMKGERNTALGWGPSFSTSWLIPRYPSLCKASRCERYKAVLVYRRQTHLSVIYQQGSLPMKSSGSFFTSASSLYQPQYETYLSCTMWGRSISKARAGVRNAVTVCCLVPPMLASGPWARNCMGRYGKTCVGACV